MLPATNAIAKTNANDTLYYLSVYARVWEVWILWCDIGMSFESCLHWMFLINADGFLNERIIIIVFFFCVLFVWFLFCVRIIINWFPQISMFVLFTHENAQQCSLSVHHIVNHLCVFSIVCITVFVSLRVFLYVCVLNRPSTQTTFVARNCWSRWWCWWWWW